MRAEHEVTQTTFPTRIRTVTKKASAAIAGLVALAAAVVTVKGYYDSQPAQKAKMHVSMAKQAEKAGDKKGAAGFFQQALQDDPGRTSTYEAAGYFYMREQNWLQGVTYLCVAYPHETSNVTLLVNLGIAYWATGQATEGETYDAAALKIAPHNDFVLRNMAATESELGRTSYAEQLAQAALDIRYTDVALENLIYALWRQGKWHQLESLASQYGTTKQNTDLEYWNLVAAEALGQTVDQAELSNAKTDLPDLIAGLIAANDLSAAQRVLTANSPIGPSLAYVAAAVAEKEGNRAVAESNATIAGVTVSAIDKYLAQLDQPESFVAGKVVTKSAATAPTCEQVAERGARFVAPALDSPSSSPMSVG